MEIDLSDFFITKSQANDFSERINAIIDTIYTADFHLEKILMQEFGLHKKDAFMKLIRENKIQDADAPAMQDFLKKIQESIAKLPIVSLTIAFDPTDETLKAFSQWFLFTLKKQVLLDIKIDRNIIAGATITNNGKFKDYSLRPLFDTVIKQVVANPIAPSPTHQSTEHITLGR